MMLYMNHDEITRSCVQMVNEVAPTGCLHCGWPPFLLLCSEDDRPWPSITALSVSFVLVGLGRSVALSHDIMAIFEDLLGVDSLKREAYVHQKVLVTHPHPNTSKSTSYSHQVIHSLPPFKNTL